MRLVLLVSILILQVSCSHTQVGTIPISGGSIENSTRVHLGLRGKVGSTDKLELYSKTVSQNITPDKLLRQTEESVYFKLSQKTTQVDDKKNVHQSLVTTFKEGSLNLHDMAYPELNEVMPFVFDSEGKVVSVGNFQEGSLFYVSPLPLPNKEVSVGDTWPYETTWWSEQSNTMMKIEILFVLKKILKCFKDELCVAIAWSGKVSPESSVKKPIEPMLPKLFESKLQGYSILRLETGTQIWSYIKNSESLKIEDVDLKVYSCIKSVLDDPAVKKEKPYCDPITDKFEFDF